MKYKLLEYIFSSLKPLQTNVLFYTPWKHQETLWYYLMFSEGLGMEYGLEIG